MRNCINLIRINKKGVGTLVTIIIVALILGLVGGVFYYGSTKMEGLPPGCQYVGQIKVLEGVNSDSFECKAEKCTLTAKMEITVATGDSAFAGKWSCYGQPDALKIFNSESECKTSYRLDRDGKQCTNTKCKEISPPLSYKANWNLCPTGNSAFKYCEGISKTAEGNVVHISDEMVLNFGDFITFKPKYPNNAPVTGKSLIVQDVDCTCEDEINSDPTNTCDPSDSKVYCVGDYTDWFLLSGKETVCYSEYMLQGLKCPNGDIPEFRPGVDSVCTTPLSKAWCRNIVNNKFKDCESDKPNSICKTWGTVKTCDPGQFCYVGSDKTNFGPGVGSCGYPNNKCEKDSIAGVPGNNKQYNVCVNVGGYYDWKTRDCNKDLIFDIKGKIEANACKCDNKCDPDYQACSDINNEEICKDYSNTDTNGLTCWKKEKVQCKGEQKCYGGQCSCDYNYDGKCTINDDDVCINDSSFATCTYTNDEKSCPTYRHNILSGFGGDCLNTEKCDETMCVPLDNLGCAFKNIPDLSTYTSLYACRGDATKDLNGKVVESCDTDRASGTYNECIEPDDIFTATKLDYDSGLTKCLENNIMEVVKYGKDQDEAHKTKFIDVYRWEIKTQCGGTSKPKCLGEQLKII